MTAYNLQWIRDILARKLGYDSTEPDQAYGGTVADPWISIDDYINEAYIELVNEAKLSVDQAHFLARYAFTWTAGSVTHTLPRDIAQARSEMLLDVTSDDIGAEIPVRKSYRAGGVYWQDDRTLHWGTTSGPSADKSLVYVYLADAERLVAPSQVPLLIPARHRHLLVWSAMVIARTVVDEDNIPRTWIGKAEKLKQDYLLDLSQGRLRFTVPPGIERATDESSGVRAWS